MVRYRAIGAVVLGILMTGLGWAASRPAPAASTLLDGPCQVVFGGSVCTWGERNASGIVRFGALVPMTTIAQAPGHEPMAFPPVARAILALPADVAQATGFNHLAVNWEAHGHPPTPFMTPHFDFHFYTTAPEAVAAIDCADTTKPAAPPAGYALPDAEIPGMGTLVGLCVPNMGMHAMPAAELAETTPFGASMVVGYYRGDLVFLEPMISQAKLMQAAAFDMTLPARPPATPASVKWPASFRAEYDGTARAYRFVFEMQ